MSRTVPTMLDLSDAANVQQATFELHRAVDFGGDAELAGWARRWGEPSVTALSREVDLNEDGVNVAWLLRKVRAADGAVTRLRGGLAAGKEPALDDIKRMVVEISAAIEDARSHLEDDE